MYGNKSVVANIDNVSSPGNITFINQGNITGYAERGTFDVAKEGSADIGNFIFGGYSYGNSGVDTIENGSSGNVKFYAPGSMGWAYTSSSNQNVKRSSINNGIMKLYGKNSIGIANNNNASSVQMAYADIQLHNPIEILGDDSVGIYITREPDNSSTNFVNSKFNIKLGGLNGSQDGTYGDSKGDINKVEYTVGLNFDFTLGSTGTEKILNNYKVEFDSDVKDSIGIRVGRGTVTFNDSNSFSQLILKGEKNIGFIADGASSKLKYDNSNKLSIDGKDQILFATANGGNLDVVNSVSLNLADTVTGFTQAYSEGTNSKVELKGGVITTVNGNDSVLFYARDNGTIKLTETLVPQPPLIGSSINGDNTGTPKINILGRNGVIYYAKNGGQIKADNSHAKISDGIVGVYSEDTTSNIDIKNSIIDYSGSGYALYSKNNGTINASGSMIILRGTATALELDLNTPSSNPINLAGAKIVAMSNDVIGVNLKNVGTLNMGILKEDIENKLGGVNIISGTDGIEVFDKYKVAAVDGGTLNIDANMDKSDTNTNSEGFFYYKRFLAQRLKLNVLNGVEVKSEINSSDATAYFKNQVVGLEMNSSKSATSAIDAQINLAAGSKVIADRTDSGNGAIGLYMNFGAIDLATGSIIEVEKATSGGNVENDKAVGIYAVNGSTVSSAGDIEVGGNQSIGILGMAYREDSLNNPIVNEFGTGGIFADQGKVTVTNAGNIVLNGTGNVGIYAYNNNAVGTKADTIVTNTGKITVGNSTSSNAAIGIYGEKATISNTGTVSVGDGGVAIYAKNGSEITNLGTLDLGADGIGVMLDGTSNISATASSVTLTSNNTGTLGKTGIFYKGTGSESQNINIAIDASALEKGTAIYAENMSVTSNGTLNIGKDGVGIFVKGSLANTGINTGNIDLTSGKIGAVGLYTKTSNIENTGTVDVRDSSQIGMYTEGTNNKAINKGTINLKVDGTTGIYVKSGAIANLDTGNNIIFDGKSSVGVFAENAKVNLKESMTFANDNINKNIYVYGKDATVGIDLGKTVTVNGGVSSSIGNKTVGIYLENSNIGSTFNGIGNLDVSNGAVGIYSKGNNILNVNVAATGDKTTGIFIDGNSTITGTVAATSGAIGVYGSGGIVDTTGGLTLNIGTASTNNKGTGMYLTDGAYATGGLITVNNASGTENIGIYYSKGTALGDVTNNSEVSLIGNNSIGIYAADKINLINNKDINSTASNSIASYVGGDSTLTSNGNITMAGADNIAIYAGKGKGTNAGTIDVSGATGTSAGMAAKADFGDTASIENIGTIKAGNNLGMYIAGNGTSSGKNIGNIATTGTGTGVYVDGSGNSFNGAGGTITSDTVGIYLKGTDANKIMTGTLNIAPGGVGVFGENASIDFEVDTSNSTGAVGVAAKGTSVISGNIKTGQGSIGVFLLDDAVTFNGATIETGASVPESSSGAADAKTSVGIIFDTGITSAYTMNNVSVNAKDGVGIYLNGTGMTLNHNGNVTTENGIGIYVKSGNILTTGASVININGGTGVFVDGGTANLGTAGNLKFNFGTGGGIGVYNNGGTLNLGNNITVTGSGSLAATSNGNLTSSGNLNIGEGGTGLLGTYDSGTITSKEIKNDGGTISSHTGGIGLAAVKGINDPTAIVTISNNGIINVEGISSGATPSPSIGIYTDVANVVNTGTINVGNKGIGIYSNNNGIMTSVQNNYMKMTGTDGIGVYLKGATSGFTSNNISSTTSKNTGVVLEGVTSAINVGTITLGNESLGIMATSGTVSAINGNITVGNSSSSKSAIGVVANGNSNVVLAGTSAITAGKNGIGVYAEGAGTTVTVSNTGNITVGTDGIYMYSKGASLIYSGNITVDNQIGIVADGGSVTATGSSTIIVKNGGIGAYIKNAAPSFGTTAITVQNGVAEIGSAPAKYSVGIYYDSVASVGTIPTVTQIGNYTIGRVLSNSTGNVAGGISIGSSGSNQVGVMAKGNSSLAVVGGVSITGGSSNIGVYGENSTITANGNISVASATSLTNSSIGIFIDKGTYIGTAGDVSVGNNSIGIYGKNLNGGIISQTGTIMNVGSNGVGIYGSGSGNINLSMGGITLNGENSIGVYAKGLNSTITGNMNIGTNTSIGIVSEGDGDVSYTGNMTIADKANSGSVGIYKLGGTTPSTITSTGSWAVGNSGYGIYLKGKATTVNNNADMALGMSSVGIFSSGVNVVNNYGDIVVGKTDIKGDHNKVKDHLNSIGIYATAGTTVNNSGNITVNHDHSVGIYGDGAGTKIKNTGTINVDGGGIGILVRDGAIAVNAVGGNIILGSTAAPDTCTATTVGMAAYSGARIENAGTITVNEGVGMLIGMGSTFTNSGTIYLKNGVGIEGPGAVNNSGHIVILPGGTGTPGANSGISNASIGSIKIESDGKITINDKYVSIGGTLSTIGDVVVNGAYVDVTTGTPLFNANSVNGDIRLLPNFASTGNGISYEIKGFVNTAIGATTGNKLTPVTSPLFIAKMTDEGNLVIAKRPYADLTIGDQFDSLDKGLDNILKNSSGVGKDAEILKGLNQYLEGLPSDQFQRETSKKIAETRGDIYATIQGRMQDINRAFDNSFYELESSYNLTKDSDKYSIIYTDGNYKDSTLGIDDYDYNIKGVLYMKEKEGLKYGNKYGYTLGFTGSKFDFDDGGSKEDVYSLRAGAHRVRNLSRENQISWLSRVELGYNRHIAKRKLNLHETYENKGEYNSYSVAFDNRLIKTIYTDLSRQLDIYADFDLEYGKVDGFKESAGSKGGLEVQIKENDYLSAEAGTGVKVSQRIYARDNISVKITTDMKYAYEFGDNYDGNKARLKNGEEGYYSLITPEKREGRLIGKIGFTVEKANHMGVTLEAKVADEGYKKDSSVEYGVRLNYKF